MKSPLNALQKKFLRAFKENELSKHFYWTGGTLLAHHYLQHRLSEDLDFFSDELFFDEYMAAQIASLKHKTGAKKVFATKRQNRQQLVFEYVSSSLKVEFVYFPFPSLAKRIQLPEFGITVDSLKDLAANKTHAAFERSEPKDVFDLYWILKKGSISLKEAVRLVEKKLGVEIDPVALVAKITHSIALLEKIRPLITDKSLFQPKKIAQFFQEEAFRYLKRHLT